MRSTFIKICGIQSIPDPQEVKEAGADAVGFVFYEKSRRYVPPPNAVVLSEVTPSRMKRVGVFVDLSPMQVVSLAATVNLDAVQLHGQETPAYCRELRQRLDAAMGRPVALIRGHRLALGDDPDEALATAQRVLPEYPVDYVLVEAAVRGVAGGSGQAWDWGLVRQLDLPMPIILAGGLTPANVAQAIREARPFGVDVSSGVETDGVKDPAKIRAFVEAARSATI